MQWACFDHYAALLRILLYLHVTITQSLLWKSTTSWYIFLGDSYFLEEKEARCGVPFQHKDKLSGYVYYD